MSLKRLDWTLCRSFLAILRDGSLSGAARTLDVAHPTMRRHLDELEATLGSALFVRSPSGLVPTALALELQPSAEAMETAAETLVRSASAEIGEVAGTVRITASDIIGVEVLPPMLARIKASNPGLDFEVVLTNTVQDILRRDADIAIRMSRPTQAELVARKVGGVMLGVYAHRDWLEVHGSPDSVEALVRSQQLVGYDRDDPSILRALAALGITSTGADFCFRSDSDLAQLGAIRAGVGAGLVQTKIGERDGNLQRILPSFQFPMEIWLAVQASNRDVARVRVVFDGLAQALKSYGSRAE